VSERVSGMAKLLDRTTLAAELLRPSDLLDQRM
jgi:hypothetical protein